LGAADIAAIADASHGLTGADLRAVVEDGKLLFAHGKACGEAPRPVEEYFLEAVAAVRGNRRNYLKRRTAQFMEAREYDFGVDRARSLTIDQPSATVAPEHVGYRPLRRRAQLQSLSDNFIDILYQQV
jgi:hypothetical protein